MEPSSMVLRLMTMTWKSTSVALPGGDQVQ